MSKKANKIKKELNKLLDNFFIEEENGIIKVVCNDWDMDDVEYVLEDVLEYDYNFGDDSEVEGDLTVYLVEA